jgi:UDP-2-acetamido-3-amino-2,3-dideoxy-glucuronate N-acetyltransferase
MTRNSGHAPADNGSYHYLIPSEEAPYRLITGVRVGKDVVVDAFTILRECQIGSRSRIGGFVEIESGVVIGSDCKIEGHTFVCDGVTIGDQVFVGHGVMFINDRHPRATTEDGTLQGDEDWELETTLVEEGASIGTAAVILCGVRIGAKATVGAGAVVTRDVQPGETVAGNPARPIARTADTP